MLTGKNAIITGCAKGIGKETLTLFAENGANIWACVRKPTEEFSNFIIELQNKYGVNIIPIYFDFANENEIKEAIKEIRKSKQNVDILVNNAGISMNKSMSLSSSLITLKLKSVSKHNFPIFSM